MKNSNVIVTIVIAVVVGMAGFFVGMKYQQSKTPKLGNRQFAMGGLNERAGQARGGNFQGSAPVSGEIISTDDTSITVKLADGSSKIVVLSDQTTINKASEGTKSDLSTGEKITAFGKTNSDGSITAQNISIGGSMMFRGGPSN